MDISKFCITSSFFCLRMILGELSLGWFLVIFVLSTSFRVKSVPLLSSALLVRVYVWETALCAWGGWHTSSMSTSNVPFLISIVLMALILQASKQVLPGWIQVLTWEWSGGSSHQLINKRCIGGSISIFAGVWWLNRYRVVSVMVRVVSCEASLSSVDIIWSSWGFVWNILSLVLAASESADTLLWNKNANSYDEDNDASNNDTSDATTTETLIF